MSVIYALMQTWPFGNSSVLVLDLNGQYVYFFEALRDCVWGDSSLLYSFSRSLGGEFLGMYAYYLASPLSYLVALFPESGLLDALFLMLLLKQGLSGLSFGYYLRKTTDLSRVSTVLFSTVYSLTAYGVVMQHNTMWTDNVILLPLLALGIRELVCHRKYKLYTFSLILALMSNFYIGYMSCIFCVLYFFYVHIALPADEKNPEKRPLPFITSGMRFAFFSLLSAAIASLIIIPAVYSLSFGKDTFSDPTYEFVTKLDIFDILSKLFFGSYDTVRPEGLPFVYCGIVTLLLIPFYFISRRYSAREKLAGSLLALVLVFSFSIQVIDMVWHGGQAPNWLNYRYSYMLAFVMIEMAAKGYHGIRDHSARWVLYSAFPLLLILLLAEHFDYAHLDTLTLPVGMNLVLIGVYVIALSLVIVRRDVTKKYATECLLVVVCLEMLLGGLLNLAQLNMDVVISSRKSYYNYKERWEEAFDTAKEQEESAFYRMEKLNYRKVNDPYMLDYRGLSGSTSTLNKDTIAFLNVMGYSSASHASRYNGTNPFTDSFLSLSYIAGVKGTVFPESYELIYDNGDVVMYKNPDALPIAFGVSGAVNDITFREYELDAEGNRVDPEDDRIVNTDWCAFERMNALCASLLGEDVQLFIPLTYRYEGENVLRYKVNEHYCPSNPAADAYVNFTVQGYRGYELYACFPSWEDTGADYYLNGKLIGRHFEDEADGYLCLGSYEDGESCTVTFKIGAEGIYISRYVKYFYAMDRAVYDRLIATLSAGGYRVEECTEDTFSGKITVQPGYETVLTTIPYDKGWQITVDGERIEGYETLDALLAFDLTPGEHTLTLRYRPKEYKIALFLFLGGCLMLGGIIACEHLIKRSKKPQVATTTGKDTEICSITSEASSSSSTDRAPS